MERSVPHPHIHTSTPFHTPGVTAAPGIFTTASSDGVVKVWDARMLPSSTAGNGPSASSASAAARCLASAETHARITCLCAFQPQSQPPPKQPRQPKQLQPKEQEQQPQGQPKQQPLQQQRPVKMVAAVKGGPAVAEGPAAIPVSNSAAPPSEEVAAPKAGEDGVAVAEPRRKPRRQQRRRRSGEAAGGGRGPLPSGAPHRPRMVKDLPAAAVVPEGSTKSPVKAEEGAGLKAKRVSGEVTAAVGLQQDAKTHHQSDLICC